MNFIVISLALALDQLLGEPKRFHPLVGFGHCANWFERVLNQGGSKKDLIGYGTLSLVLLVVPPILCTFIVLQLSGDYAWLVSIFVVYWAIGFKSMTQHTQAVFEALSNSDISDAREAVSRIVSRDTEHMDKKQITSASIESSLENGCDSIFGVLFWYVIGGAPAVVFYRLINTLDAMWGYRNKRFEYFGKVAARLDDILNYIPARLTAFSYAIMGRFKLAIQSWLSEANQLASPNAGPVMTAGAGSLDIHLGGEAYYDGKLLDKPSFGGTRVPSRHHINSANKLVWRSILLWCAIILAVDVVLWLVV